MNRKRTVIICLVLCLLLIGGIVLMNLKPQENAPVEPPKAEVEYQIGLARGYYGCALYTTFERGDEVEVVGELRDFYVIAGEKVNLLIEKRFLRPETEAAPGESDGYTKAGTSVYSTAYLRGEAIASLGKNTKIRVLDKKAGWMMIEWEGGTGFISSGQYSKNYIQAPKPSKPSNNGPQDGGDIVLDSSDLSLDVTPIGTYLGPEYGEFEACKGTILSPETEAYLYLYDRDEEVKVTEVGEEECTVYFEDDLFAKLPRYLVWLEGDEEYESWEGYAAEGAAVYSELQKWHSDKKLKRNDRVTVIDELPTCYVVEIDGEIGYMAISGVSKTEIKVKPSSGGGNSGGGGFGGGGEWTPPAL
ncbi:MAG: hypothetical protein E7328_01120 [Clostridiales bacterium]|nr:hypothetical protein [Clostridiales bacterium]